MNVLRLERTNINKVLTVPFVTSQKDTDNGPSGPGGAVAVVGTVASQQEVPGLGVSVYFLCGVWGRTGAARHTQHHHNCTTSSVVRGEICKVPNYQQCDDDSAAAVKKLFTVTEKTHRRHKVLTSSVGWFIYH